MRLPRIKQNLWILASLPMFNTEHLDEVPAIQFMLVASARASPVLLTVYFAAYLLNVCGFFTWKFSKKAVFCLELQDKEKKLENSVKIPTLIYSWPGARRGALSTAHRTTGKLCRPSSRRISDSNFLCWNDPEAQGTRSFQNPRLHYSEPPPRDLFSS